MRLHDQQLVPARWQPDVGDVFGMTLGAIMVLNLEPSVGLSFA